MKIKYIPSRDERSHIQNFNIFIEKNFPQLLTEENPELLLITGGDGSMLHATKIAKSLNIPVLGKSAGTLNFITSSFPEGKDFETINKILKDELKISILKMGTINVKFSNTSQIFNAVNDIIIGREINDWHHFKINTVDKYFNDFELKGLGLCLSTPLGSTGFNANNHGQILRFNINEEMKCEQWSLTSIASSANINEVMFPQKMTIELLSNRQPINIYFDGTKHIHQMSEGDSMEITKGEIIEIAYLNEREMFDKRIEMSINRR